MHKTEYYEAKKKGRTSVTLQLSASPGLGRCGWKGGERTGVVEGEGEAWYCGCPDVWLGKWDHAQK